MDRKTTIYLFIYLAMLSFMSGCTQTIVWNDDVVERYKSDALFIDTRVMDLPNQVDDNSYVNAIALYDSNVYFLHGDTLYKTSLDGAQCVPVVHDVTVNMIITQYQTGEVICWNKTKDANIRVLNMKNDQLTIIKDADSEMLDVFRGSPVKLFSDYYFCRAATGNIFEIVKYDQSEYTVLSSFSNQNGLNHFVNLYTNGSLLYWIENTDMTGTYLIIYDPNSDTKTCMLLDCDNAMSPYINNDDLIMIKSTVVKKGLNTASNYSMVIQRNFKNSISQEVLVDFAPYTPYDSDPLAWNIMHGHDYESPGFYNIKEGTLYRIEKDSIIGRLRFNPDQGAILTDESGMYVFLND